ncbi:MAG: hypothetical protein ACRCS8_06100 [Brevinema sp.]
MVIKYLEILVKNIVWLLFACSYIVLVLTALGYPVDVVIINYLNLVFFTLPWYLWVHQILFCSIAMRSYRLLNPKFAFMSVLVGTVLMLLIFPLTQVSVPAFEKINPNRIVRGDKTIFPSREGTLLLIDEEALFARKNSKALWIGEQSLIASRVYTNGMNIRIGDVRHFDGTTYREQWGSKEISLYQAPRMFKKVPGTESFYLWFDSVRHMQHFIGSIYKNRNFNLKRNTETRVSINNQKASFSKFKAEAARPIPKSINKKNKKTRVVTQKSLKIENYIETFISIFNLMLFATFLGFASAFHQNLLNTLSLIGISSLFVPYKIISLEKFAASIKVPVVPELFILSVLSIAVSALIIMNRSYLEKTYAKNR